MLSGSTPYGDLTASSKLQRLSKMHGVCVVTFNGHTICYLFLILRWLYVIQALSFQTQTVPNHYLWMYKDKVKVLPPQVDLFRDSGF